MKATFFTWFALTATACSLGAIESPWINEIHYDNTGTDSGEFVEIAGLAGTDLSGYSILLYNGSGGALYNTTALTGVIPDLQSGFGTLAFFYAANGIQNGSPDGLALVNGSDVIQFLSYEGTFTAVGGAANGVLSEDIGVSEPGDVTGSSLQLVGTGGKYEDFTWSPEQTATAGALNTGQVFAGTPVSVPDGGATAALMGFALLGLYQFRRLART